MEEATAKDYYFDSYSHFGIHSEMLDDTQRTLAYRDAIKRNPELFKDKIVMDVGCGTGILSFFALQAGAKHVYAVDSSTIIHKAREIAQCNGFGPDRITFIHGKVEDITLGNELPSKVDAIISEWMGYFCLYESMLDSVLFARDNFLNEDGAILPNKCNIYLSVMTDDEGKGNRIDSWDNVYGFNYGPIKEWALVEPVTDTVNPNNIASKPFIVQSIDIMKATVPELDFAINFSMPAQKETWCQGFVGWFDVDFDLGKVPIKLSTSPWQKPTHWCQCLFYTKDDYFVTEEDVIEGTLSLSKNARNVRDLDVTIEWAVGDESFTSAYKMR
ncbi:Protein arginine N-methyltransferase [Carpediemonas membranifera]|uniref:type I protein arginine methyltransferase n=1 Tax=Carpediemonas membranifera TaxID=201153 RepID=A0A8J6B5C2_9EUKA|nr:Protein arginine N-methyltransferase [Carpediemonas membranifera]|eukprot:KAG9393197.1 Protein arginine N-methyltransferase [Carpediemonas membranifera]